MTRAEFLEQAGFIRYKHLWILSNPRVFYSIPKTVIPVNYRDYELDRIIAGFDKVFAATYPEDIFLSVWDGHQWMTQLFKEVSDEPTHT